MRVNRRLWQSCSAPYRWKVRNVLKPVPPMWTLDKERRSDLVLQHSQQRGGQMRPLPGQSGGRSGVKAKEEAEVRRCPLLGKQRRCERARRVRTCTRRRKSGGVDQVSNAGSCQRSGRGSKRTKGWVLRVFRECFHRRGRKVTHLACARDVLSKSVC